MQLLERQGPNEFPVLINFACELQHLDIVEVKVAKDPVLLKCYYNTPVTNICIFEVFGFHLYSVSMDLPTQALTNLYEQSNHHYPLWNSIHCRSRKKPLLLPLL